MTSTPLTGLERPTPQRPMRGGLRVVPQPKPKRIRGLYVPADPGRLAVRDLSPGLEPLRNLLDADLIEAIFGVGAVMWHAYLDEEGKLKALPVNVRATKLARTLGWPTGDLIAGPAVFLGSDRNGGEADVPPAVVASAQSLGYGPR